MSGWGCPHDSNGECLKVPGHACDPGMKGCVLFGRFAFSKEEKNRPEAARQRRRERAGRR
ncbi:MAG: hypothetical protein Kow0096_06490 [Thiohalomonadaceae bacterium]